jgi:hypothetical protein
MRLILAFLLLLSVPLFSMKFTLQIAKNPFSAGERVGLSIEVQNDNGTLASNYVGWIKLRSTDPTLRIQGKNPDSSDVDLTGTGNILIGAGMNETLYISTFRNGSFSLKMEEYMQNGSSSVSTKSTQFTVIPLERSILFNEIMFKSVSSNFQYIELYNNSDTTVNLSNLSIYRYLWMSAHPTSNTTNKQLFAFIPGNVFLAPNNYFIITRKLTEAKKIFTNIINPKSSAVDSYTSPYKSKYDAWGYSLLCSINGTNQDAFEYSADDTTENVSLECQSFSLTASWAPSLSQSSVLSSFFGTPGRTNSTFARFDRTSVNIHLTNDRQILPAGETCHIKFTSDTPGRTAVFLLDASGRRIRELFAESDTGRGVEYPILFDGTDGNSKPLPVGPYVVNLRFINDELGLTLTKNIIIIVGWNK